MRDIIKSTYDPMVLTRDEDYVKRSLIALDDHKSIRSNAVSSIMKSIHTFVRDSMLEWKNEHLTIDHVNRDTMDVTVNNLRLCTSKQQNNNKYNSKGIITSEREKNTRDVIRTLINKPMLKVVTKIDMITRENDTMTKIDVTC